jgi:hypothetical protein
MYDSVSDRFKFCIQSLAERLGFKKKFQVTGYTTLKVYKKDCMQPVMAIEYVSGGKRYDYAMVQFENDDESLATYPAKMIGFVHYDKTPGIPTPHFVDSIMGLGLQEIHAMNQKDHYLYSTLPKIIFPMMNFKKTFCAILSWVMSHAACT